MRRVLLTAAMVAATVACSPASVVDRGPADRPEVTLTFDVAYESGYTAAFLDVLRRDDIRATMFVTGEWAERNPALAARMTAEGHLVANHSYDHPDFKTVSDAEISRQVALAETVIAAQTGRSTKPYLRPPYGSQDQRVNQVLGNEGFRYDVLWTVDSLGWKGLTAPEVVKRCIDRAGPGVLYMFHLSAKADLDALPWIIQWLRNHGYSFVRMDAWWP